MTNQADDHLGRALTALNNLLSPDVYPAARQELQEALLKAQQERQALCAVAQEARGLVKAIDEYDQAAETGEAGEAGEAEAICKLGEACIEAEGALVDALYRQRAIEEADDEDTAK